MPYNINGQTVALSAEPFENGGAYYVPLADIVRQLGGTVSWDNESKTAQATIGQWTASVQMANSTVDVSGTTVNLSAPPLVDNDTIYVPWDFFRDAYGYQVNLADGTLDIHL